MKVIYTCMSHCAAPIANGTTIVSDINNGITYHKQRVTAWCTTRGPDQHIMSWYSFEYIDSNGLPLQLFSSTNESEVRSTTDPDLIATRVSVTRNNGKVIMVSRLHFTASKEHPNATVSCAHAGDGIREKITFSTIRKSSLYTVGILTKAK